VTPSPSAVALAGAVEQLLTTLVRRRRVLGDAEPSPLSTFQGVALGELVDGGPLRLRALADALRTTDATASRTVDVLVGHGLADRRTDPDDGRGVLVEATAAGREAVRERRLRLALLLESLVAEMSPSEGRHLTDLLDELHLVLARHDA
jgi:DNA-binding MarR family transcriptional regulator